MWKLKKKTNLNVTKNVQINKIIWKVQILVRFFFSQSFEWKILFIFHSGNGYLFISFCFLFSNKKLDQQQQRLESMVIFFTLWKELINPSPIHTHTHTHNQVDGLINPFFLFFCIWNECLFSQKINERNKKKEDNKHLR